MKAFFYLALSLFSVARADDTNAAPVVMPSAIDSAAVDPTEHQTPMEMWAEISDQGKKVMLALQAHDPSVKMLVPQVERYLKSYLMKFPNDAHVPEAKMMSAQVSDLANSLQLPDAPTAEAVTKQFNDMANDISMPTQLRAEASLMTVAKALQDARKTNTAASWDALDGKISDFEQNFGTISFDGKTPAVAMLRQEQVKLVEDSGDTVRLKALLTKLASDPHPEIAAMAKQEAAGASTAPIPQGAPAQ